jgi:geranylgeranyl pyrophosphate synthase
MLTNQLESGFVAVDQTLLDVVATDVEMLQDASHHIIASGGKRIRPRVVFLSYLAAGGTNLDEVVPLAAAIELVHTATLVHDDINDHSLTRRGKISVHARFGHTFALLTGDYLFTKVYELMAPYGPQYNRIMAGACVSLVEGETLQAAAAKAGTINQETYKVIITRKTASLFGAAARMGSSLAGGDEALASKLSEYGYNLGLAFQIVDDILDIVGDPDMMGKPVGRDLAQGAGALIAQNGKKGLGPTNVSSPDPIDEYIARLRDSGAVDVAFAQAHEWAGRAKEALTFLPDSPARIELYRLVELVIERQK